MTVGAGGRYTTLTEAFEALENVEDLYLCLRPGVHVIEGPFDPGERRSIRLTGAGVAASVIELRGELRLVAEEIELRDLSLRLSDNAYSVVLEGTRITACNCLFDHSRVNAKDPRPLVLVRSREARTHLTWRDNHMSTGAPTEPPPVGGPVNTESLALADHRIGGVIADNLIAGHLVLMQARPDPLDADTPLNRPDGAVSFAPGGRLQLRGNQLGRVLCRLDTSADALEIYAGMHVSDNVFDQIENSFAACVLTLEGNQFAGAAADGDLAAFALGQSGVFSANQAGHPRARIRPSLTHKAESSNLLTFWEPEISISTTSQEFTATGGIGSVDVETDPANRWTVSRQADWLEITSERIVRGNGTVNYRVLGNCAKQERTAQLVIGDCIFTVTQAACEDVSCEVLLSEHFGDFDQHGGAAKISVGASENFAWTAQVSSIHDWITITAGSSGEGSGVVDFEVAHMIGTSSREGVIIVAGKSVRITQIYSRPLEPD